MYLECGSLFPLFCFKGCHFRFAGSKQSKSRHLESISYEMQICKPFILIFIQNGRGVGGDASLHPCLITSILFPMREESKMFATVEEAVEDIRQGHMVVLVDDEDRENEGDLAMAAEKITPDAINFMAKYGRGLICLPLTEERCDELHLPLMSQINTSVHGTAFTEAVDARVGVTTGISASDRAITILTAIDPKTKPQDLARPGHIFPLRARNGGVLVRAGQTEASVDLARIAGLTPASVICEIMNEDGTMARVPQLIEFCKEHNLKMLTVADLIRYRMQHER